MVKGVFVAFGIMLVLAVIPIVHFVGIPFGPFIGGYFGISAASSSTRSYAVKSLIFGTLLGGMVFVVLAAVAVALMLTTGLNLVLVWLVVVVLTMYTASMGALGALYAQLRAAEKDSAPQAPLPAAEAILDTAEAPPV